MRKAWGRPPQNDRDFDLKLIIVGLLIGAAVIYLLFPRFWQDLLPQGELGEIVLPSYAATGDYLSGDLSAGAATLPSVFDSLYRDVEVSRGYWIMFVGDGELQQLELSLKSYEFILAIIDKDTRSGTAGEKPLLAATDGQLSKYTVSNQVFTIIQNLTLIESRAGSI